MIPTISISDLQRNLAKKLKGLEGYAYIFSNNKPTGAIVDLQFMSYLEKMGVVEDYEDYMLLQNAEEEMQEVEKIMKTGDFSETLTFDELCQSI